MMEDVIDPSEQAPIDEISSPISPHIFDFCDPDLFSETLQNSEGTSCSNCCYEDNSYASSLAVPLDKFSTHHQQHSNANTSANTPTTTSTTTTTTTATTSANNSNLSIIFDSPEQFDNDISASIDFSSSPHFTSVPNLLQNGQQVDQFDFSVVQQQQQHQIPLTSDIVVDGLSAASHYSTADPTVSLPLMGPPLTSVFDEDCLSSVPSYAPFTPSSPSSYSFLGPAIGSYMPAAGTMNPAALSADTSGLFTGGLFMGSDFQTQELDYQGDNAGIFCPDSLLHVFNPGDLQKALTSDSQNLVGSSGNPTPLASEISNLDDPILKVSKLSVEQRKEKIHRYMKKRNERNFSKKIKYACRKTLADSRPRVRGRFAKNDDFGENPRPSCSNYEEDTDDEIVVKEQEELVDSSDIFAHISGVNSFKCNYPIQSWI